MPEEKSINGGELNPAIITQDDEFNKFLMTLPENQRQTPESKYYTYKMWKIAGKPKDFNQAVDMELYHWNDNDRSYHGNSVIYDEESDVYHFLKPKDHSTVQYELDWYHKGVTTDDNGNQYELAGDSKAEWEDFRRNYYLDSSGDDYAYRRRPTLGIPDKARNGIMASLENGVKAALQNKLSSINQSLQESKVNKFGTGGDTENNQPAILDELNPSVVVDYSNLKQEAKDARDWVFDYYASEGYKNRAKQAELSARNPLKKHLGIFPKKKLRFEEDWSVDSSYNWLYPVIGLQESENPFTRNHADEVGFTTAHEFAHNSKLFNTPAKSYESTYRSPYYNNSYKKLPKKYIDALEVKQLVAPHDMEFSESYSDLIGLRYLLDKYNIFDSKDSNAVFDSKMYNNLIQDERFKNNRFLKLHEEKQVIDAINNVAQNTTDSNRLDYINPDNIAAFGGELNRFDEGGDTEDRGKLSSLLEYIAELGTFVPATSMGVYLNTINSRGKETPEPKNVEDSAVETPAYEHKDWMDSYSREDFDKYVNSPEREVKWALQNFNGWSKEDLDYLYSKLGDTGWDPKALAYAISGETNFRPYVENRVSSAIGLAQLTKAQMETLFGKNDWESVYNSYITRNRSVKEIIDDTIKQYKWMYDRIKTEPDNMGYGRLKVNLLAPNSGLDSKVSNVIFKNSLTDSQKDKLIQGESTYRDLMKMYDDEFNEHFIK